MRWALPMPEARVELTRLPSVYCETGSVPAASCHGTTSQSFTLINENPMHRLAGRRLACALALAALLAPGTVPD